MQPCKLEHSARSTHRRGHRARHALHRDRRGNMPAVCKRAARWQTRTFVVVSHDCSLWCCFRFACAQGRRDAQMARQSSVVRHDAEALRGANEGGPGEHGRAARWGMLILFFPSVGSGCGQLRGFPKAPKKTADRQPFTQAHKLCSPSRIPDVGTDDHLCFPRVSSGRRRRSPVARRRHPWRAPPSAAGSTTACARAASCYPSWAFSSARPFSSTCCSCQPRPPDSSSSSSSSCVRSSQTHSSSPPPSSPHRLSSLCARCQATETPRRRRCSSRCPCSIYRCRRAWR